MMALLTPQRKVPRLPAELATSVGLPTEVAGAVVGEGHFPFSVPLASTPRQGLHLPRTPGRFQTPPSLCQCCASYLGPTAASELVVTHATTLCLPREGPRMGSCAGELQCMHSWGGWGAAAACVCMHSWGGWGAAAACVE